MASWYFFFLVFSILFCIVLGMTAPVYKRHKEAAGRIVNYDSVMRKFVYKVTLSPGDIINLLKEKIITDELFCTFDFDRSVVNFADDRSSRDYYFQLQECSGYTILRLNQVALIGSRSLIPYKLNPFFVSKLHAEIIPYSLYGI